MAVVLRDVYAVRQARLEAQTRHVVHVEECRGAGETVRSAADGAAGAATSITCQ